MKTAGTWASLREIPGIFSQGETLEELKLNIKDAFELMLEEEASLPVSDCESIELHLGTA